MVEATAQQQIEIGQRCELLLRPQHVQISAAEESSVTVLEQQFMGDHCRYVIDASGHRLLASSSEPLTIGQQVSVKVETQGVLAF
jgi:iron(III) transport system ATP-binding protein